MKNEKEVEKGLAEAKPGTVIKIINYRNTAGEVKPEMTLRILRPEEYKEMQAADLEKLEAFKPTAADGDASVPDLETARTKMLTSLKKSLDVDASSSYRGADYQSVGGGSLARHPDKTGIYVMRLAHQGNYTTPITGKGTITRAKKTITAGLDLPTRRYVHAIRLTDGDFDSVEIITKGA